MEVSNVHTHTRIKKQQLVFEEGCALGGGKDARIPASSSRDWSPRRQRRRSFPNANELSKNIRIPKMTGTTEQRKNLRPQKFHQESTKNYPMHSNSLEHSKGEF